MTNNNKQGIIISLIFCCYNVSDYLSDMLDSLLKQSWLDNDKYKHTVGNDPLIEIILIDDCSNDDGQTLAIMKRFHKLYSNVKLIKLRNNVGASEARNIGIRHSSGVYISFLDSDDVMVDGIIQKYFDAIKNKSTDLVVAGVVERHISKKNKIIVDKRILPDKVLVSGKYNIAELSVDLEDKVLLGYCWNKLYKKGLITNNDLKFDKFYLMNEDIIFNIAYLRLCNSVSCIEYPAIFYYRRMKAGNSITSNFEKDYFKYHYKRIEALYSYWMTFDCLRDKAIKVLSKFYFRYAVSAIWRNNNKHSLMSIEEQKKWIKDFYLLDLTKKLLKYYSSGGMAMSLWIYLIKNRRTRTLIFLASIMNFIDKYFEKFFIRLRTKR